MLKYIVDGSQKGMMIGAGVIEMDSCGFFTPHSFFNYHACPTSLLAEIFAVRSALRLISEKQGELLSSITIFSDNQSVVSLFNHSLNKSSLSFNPYILETQQQLLLLQKITDVRVLSVTEEFKPLLGAAHDLSRSYLKEADKQIFLKEKSSPASVAIHSKKTSRVIKLHVEKKEKTWALLVNGVEKQTSKKFLSLIEDFTVKHKSQIGSTLTVEMSAELMKMLTAIQTNKKAISFISLLNKK